MRVLISGVTGDAGVAASRLLAARGFTVLGVDSRRLPRLLVPGFLEVYECVPDEDPAAWSDRVLALLRETRAEAFLPLCSLGFAFAVRHRVALAPWCFINCPDPESFLAAFDKRLCIAECRRLGIPCAGTLTLGEAEESLRRGEVVVVKPASDIGAARGVCYVRSVGELEEAIRRCEGFGHGYLIEEFIPGGGDAMRTVVVVFGRDSQLLGAFTTQKLLQWPSSGGVMVIGRSTHDPDLLAQILPFFREWKWRGPAEVELKLDARDGQFKVIEINPRFPGYLRLAGMCGLDLAVMAVTGESYERVGDSPSLSSYHVGKKYLAPQLFLHSLAREASIHGWLSATRKLLPLTRGSWGGVAGFLANPVPILARVFVRTPSRASRLPI